MEERWLLDSLKAGGSRPIFNQLSQDISFNICLNWTDNYRKKCKILWKAGLCELTRISETTCDLTQGSTSLQHPHSLLEGILREGEQMLPQIKLIQAVDRVFPELSGQQKYGSSKKKKGRKKGFREIFWPRSACTGRRGPRKRACVQGSPPLHAREAPFLAASDIRLPGGLEWRLHAKLHMSQVTKPRPERYP